MAPDSLSKARASFSKLFKSNSKPQGRTSSESPKIDSMESQTSAMASPATVQKHSTYRDPIIVPPSSGNHKQSFIVLHGRGSEGEMFGRALLRTPVTGYGTLQDAFPDAKFGFPTAAKRRAQLYNRMPINQWFDNWSLQDPDERAELQFDGLRESTNHIHGLLETEVRAVGAGNVILWGLSQGCALSMISLLLWQGPRYAATIGMCGWLPLRKRMEEAMRGDCADEADDLFARDQETNMIAESLANASKMSKAIAYLRRELEISSAAYGNFFRAPQIPVFLGHGAIDPKVPAALGREAAEFLRQVDMGVEYKEYDKLAHWYSSEMLGDIVQFIERKAKWPVVKGKLEKIE